MNSGRVLAHRIGPDGARGPAFAQADVYGRGLGSTASERGALFFRRLDSNAAWPVGEALELTSPDGLSLDLDVTGVA